MFYSIIQVFASLFICLAIGFVCMKQKMIDHHVVTGLSSLLINVVMPALLIISLQKPFSTSLLREISLFLLMSTGFYLAGIPLAYLVCRLLKATPTEKSIWLFTLVFPNVGYMGIPVATAIYGQEALIYVSIHMLVFNALMFTVGTAFMSTDKIQIKSLLLKPPIFGTILGFLFFLTSYSIPALIYNPLEMIGGMTTPLSMIIVGALLAEIKPSEVFKDVKVYFIAFIRLLVFPLFVYIVCSIIPLSPLMRNILVILFAMPTAAATTAFAVRYNADYSLASKIIFITTILSAFTIPAILLVFG